MSERVMAGLGRGFVALGERDYRLYSFGHIIALVGMWMQSVGQGWLVLELTDSPFALGLVYAFQFLPVLFLALLGGVLADRLPKRSVLLGTAAATMVLAFALFGLTASGLVQLWHVLVLAALLGLVSAAEFPARHAFIGEVVSSRHLLNAVALNNASFNASRMIGPGVAGLLIGWAGLAGCFLLNGLGYLPMLAALLAMRGARGAAQGGAPQAGGAGPRPSVWGNLREGLSYVAHTPSVRLTLVLLGALALLTMNQMVLVPVFARNVLAGGPDTYGFLLGALGLGALVGALLQAYVGGRPRRWVLFAGASGLAATSAALSATRSFGLAVAVLVGAGFAMVIFTTTANTYLQTTAPSHLRGRVMSVYTTVFIGSTPLGSLLAGTAADLWGVEVPLLLGGVVGALVALAVRAAYPREAVPAAEPLATSTEAPARV